MDQPHSQQESEDSTHNEEFYDSKTQTFMPLSGIRAITPSYLAIASEKSRTLPERRKMLIVLDLNGTLFFRNKKVSGKPTIVNRPYLLEFMRLLFTHFRVMIWSSSRRESVDAMLNRIPKDFGKFDRIWSREHFDLHEVDFHRKVLTLKDLEKVWQEIESEKEWASPAQLEEQYAEDFDQTNTILVDDSKHKSQLQPYNCIPIADFDFHRAENGTDIELLKVWQYLELASMQSNVSAFMREFPFSSNAEILKRPVEKMKRLLAESKGPKRYKRITEMRAVIIMAHINATSPPPPPTTVDEVKESYIEKLKLLRQEVKDKLDAKKHKKPKKMLPQATGAKLCKGVDC
ncbi:hypothetical protein MVEG_02713 [Podila verticillata NRRL 6337]|nr:hypothetical protein MVEG_02713 [Podila verticillata NRRL 6337]